MDFSGFKVRHMGGVTGGDPRGSESGGELTLVRGDMRCGSGESGDSGQECQRSFGGFEVRHRGGVTSGDPGEGESGGELTLVRGDMRCWSGESGKVGHKVGFSVYDRGCHKPGLALTNSNIRIRGEPGHRNGRW
eukprot:4205058-Prymnesium_polylepis.1